jgi:hypothetical protein
MLGRSACCTHTILAAHVHSLFWAAKFSTFFSRSGRVCKNGPFFAILYGNIIVTAGNSIEPMDTALVPEQIGKSPEQSDGYE